MQGRTHVDPKGGLGPPKPQKKIFEQVKFSKNKKKRGLGPP